MKSVHDAPKRIPSVAKVRAGMAGRIHRMVGVVGSQRKFAALVGVTPPTITGWLSGSPPYPNNVEKIAEATGVSLRWLHTGDGDDEKELDIFRSRIGVPGTPKSEIGMILPDPPGVSSKVEAGDFDTAAEHLNAEELAQLVARVLANHAMPEPRRKALARRLNAVLSRKLGMQAH